ncbi:hypothetical protein FOC1_g10016196 [Fusarium oxysporum f. sp. cubense race 1]|uniref:Uncharacterized protein n=1 Tax=Fusarium oxysporum f. sp. cubense (strain race 1) TaxID=1229664 RepID=N4TQB8_FUSC1|nr:hypothetical protein FOC1_g10016196 [Fusarium oxysporum f. sp. cubense race 1]
MASMDHIDAARARLHSLFNASFEKKSPLLSSATDTICGREHHTPYSFLDDPGIDKNCRLQYNIVVSSCNFCMAKYQDLVNFAVFCHAIASYGVDETRKMCRTKLE